MNDSLLNDLRFVSRNTKFNKTDIINLAAKIAEKNPHWTLVSCLHEANDQLTKSSTNILIKAFEHNTKYNNDRLPIKNKPETK